MEANAEKNTSKADVHQYGHSSQDKGVHRTPVRLPIIEIISDSDIRSIEFCCLDDYDVEIWIFDTKGNIIDSSTNLNSILFLPDNGSNEFYIRIDSYNWYATATITL